MIALLSYAAAAAAMVAAFCWGKAATAFVPAPPREDNALGQLMDGAFIIMVGKSRARLFETLEMQSRWNARGAAAAAISAVLTALAVVVADGL